MKAPLIFTLLTVSTFSVFGQTTDQIVASFRTQATAASERFDSTLQREGAAIANRLASQGDTAGQAQVTEQVKAKLNGESVPSPHAALATLFSQYDSARDNALKPVREASLKELDAISSTAAAQDVSKARDEITQGPTAASAASVSSSAPAASPAPTVAPTPPTAQAGAGSVESLFVGKSWYSHTGVEYIFNSDKSGKRNVSADNQTTFTWKVGPNDIVEVNGRISPREGPVKFFFKFLNADEALFGRNAPELIGDKASTTKPAKK